MSASRPVRSRTRSSAAGFLQHLSWAGSAFGPRQADRASHPELLQWLEDFQELLNRSESGWDVIMTPSSLEKSWNVDLPSFGSSSSSALKKIIRNTCENTFILNLCADRLWNKTYMDFKRMFWFLCTMLYLWFDRLTVECIMKHCRLDILNRF